MLATPSPEILPSATPLLAVLPTAALKISSGPGVPGTGSACV